MKVNVTLTQKELCEAVEMWVIAKGFAVSVRTGILSGSFVTFETHAGDREGVETTATIIDVTAPGVKS